MKKILVAGLCAAALISTTACGASTESTETSTETSTLTSDKKSSEFDLSNEDQVSKLADYSEVPVTLATSYEVTEDAENDFLTTLLTQYGGVAYKEVTDRTTVEADDYVMVDYTGYKDGEAFDGGSAEDQLLDVSGNCAVGGTTGFIDGFTSGLVGAEVGKEVDCPCTFPDNYSSEELAGQDVTFTFKVKGIYSHDTRTFDDLTDDEVNELFGSTASITTVKDLKSAVKKQLESNLYSVEVDAIKEYMIDNSTVDVPEDYLTARVVEYEESFVADNITGDTQTLEDYLSSNYNMTVSDAESTWKTSLEEQIKIEFIFGLIAEKENIEIDEDDFNDYVDYIISSSSSRSTPFEDEDDVYKYFGSGDKEYGKTYLQKQYLVNKAIDLVQGTCKVTYSDDTESTETTEE